jgi:hypothetical protein
VCVACATLWGRPGCGRRGSRAGDGGCGPGPQRRSSTRDTAQRGAPPALRRAARPLPPLPLGARVTKRGAASPQRRPRPGPQRRPSRGNSGAAAAPHRLCVRLLKLAARQLRFRGVGIPPPQNPCLPNLFVERNQLPRHAHVVLYPLLNLQNSNRGSDRCEAALSNGSLLPRVDGGVRTQHSAAAGGRCVWLRCGQRVSNHVCASAHAHMRGRRLARGAPQPASRAHACSRPAQTMRRPSAAPVLIGPPISAAAPSGTAPPCPRL